MADIPAHLLERAKARRSALSGTTHPTAPDPDAPTEAVATTTTAASTAPPPSPLPEAGTPLAKTTPTESVKGAAFARIGAVTLLTVLPIWALFMFNTWATPRADAVDPASLGASLYTANCVACHGADGRGGAGKQLNNGEVLKTFPDPISQMQFVKHGSCAKGTNYGNPDRDGGQRVAESGMPAWTKFTDEEIAAIVIYERTVLQGKSFPTATADMFTLADGSVNPAGPADLATFTIDASTICPS